MLSGSIVNLRHTSRPACLAWAKVRRDEGHGLIALGRRSTLHFIRQYSVHAKLHGLHSGENLAAKRIP